MLLEKSLIIKLGALGDVLRTTAILNDLGGDITWITRPDAVPLLKGIDGITRVVSCLDDIKGEHFDSVYNLDDDLEGCNMLKAVRFGTLYGFYEFHNKVLPMPEAEEWWAMSLNGPDDRDERKKSNRNSFQHYLFKNIGKEFTGQDYVFGYASKEVSANVVGLEARAGDRWPMKAWPFYRELESRLRSEGYDVRVLEQRNDIRDYIEDINSCRLVVSGDTLAMHVALALKKKVVALFGPTNPHEIEMYGRGDKIYTDMPCSFCFIKTPCEKKPNCMESISVDKVHDSVKRLLA